MLVFIPAVGEFVIPSLLGGPDNLMIGRVLWDEFFGNHDWPVASAVAIAFLLLLAGPIAIYQYYNVGSSRPEARMERRYSPLLLTVLCLGIAVLYLPILVLIAYSFNASPLVNVWGGFSTAWYGQLLHNRQLLQAALLSLEVAVTASTAARWSSARWRRSRWCASPAFAADCC